MRLCLLSLLWGCGSLLGYDSSDDFIEDTGFEVVEEPVEPSVAIDSLAVFDPIGGPALDIAVVQEGDGQVQLSVLDEQDAEIAQVEGSWDGRDAAGNWAQAGVYTLRANVIIDGRSVAEDLHDIRLVRCGVTTAYAEGDGGASANFVPLYWNGSEQVQDSTMAFTYLSSLEDELGQPRTFPETTEQVDALPDVGALPVAYSWSSRPLLSLVLGEETVLGSSGLSGAGVRVSAEGWDVVAGGDALEPTVPITLQMTDILSNQVGIVDHTVTLDFQVDDADGQAVTIATQDVPVRFLSVLGESGYDGTDDLYNSWVAVVVPALEAIDGTPADAASVQSALVDWIFNDHGLEYDTRWGASAYTTYRAGDYERAHFRLTQYLALAAGTTVNCTDCASILGVYSNMLGARTDYGIVLPSFELNYILAIGGSDYTHCPFGSGGCGFSYHAISTPDDGETIFDATLALDGDANPGSEPHEILLVQELTDTEYLERLVMSGSARVQYVAQETIQ